MNSEIFTNIVLGVIMICGTIITYFLIPLIKSKIGAENYKKFIDFAEKLVRAANQLFDENDKKKQYVLEQCLEWAKNNGITLEESQIDAIIEGLVNYVKLK